jgi:hypothetical protein
MQSSGRAESLGELAGEIVAAERLDAFVHVARDAVAQVGAHEIERAPSRGAIEGTDLAERSGNRLVALGHLDDDVYGKLHELTLPWPPAEGRDQG